MPENKDELIKAIEDKEDVERGVAAWINHILANEEDANFEIQLSQYINDEGIYESEFIDEKKYQEKLAELKEKELEDDITSSENIYDEDKAIDVLASKVNAADYLKEFNIVPTSIPRKNWENIVKKIGKEKTLQILKDNNIKREYAEELVDKTRRKKIYEPNQLKMELEKRILKFEDFKKINEKL